MRQEEKQEVEPVARILEFQGWIFWREELNNTLNWEGEPRLISKDDLQENFLWSGERKPSCRSNIITEIYVSKIKIHFICIDWQKKK